MRLDVEGAGKRYTAATWALRDFTASFTPGVTGLLGPNGAGKSTLLRILATISRPSEGRVRWNGIDVAGDPDALRGALGYLPQDFGVYPQLTAREFLETIAAAKGLGGRAVRHRIDELLAMVNLLESRDRPLGGFSGGMRQRVGIAQALLGDPQVVVVDEPTAGLDPEERVRFRHLVTELGADRIVLLSTHIVSDVEASATRIVLLAGGRIAADGEPAGLLDAVRGRVWELAVRREDLERARRAWAVSASLLRGDTVRLRVVADAAPRPDAVAAEPSLEDAYLWWLARARERAAA